MSNDNVTGDLSKSSFGEGGKVEVNMYVHTHTCICIFVFTVSALFNAVIYLIKCKCGGKGDIQLKKKKVEE